MPAPRECLGEELRSMAYLGFRTRNKALSTYLRQLATYFDAGVDARTVFKSLAKNAPSRGMRQASALIVSEVEAGARLGEAFAKAERYFRPLVVQLVKAGEQTGNLEEVFSRLSEYYEWRRSLHRSIIARLVYPAIGLFLAVHIIAAITYFLPYRVFGTASASTILFWFYALIAIAVSLPWLSRTLLGGTNILDYLVYYLPILGKQLKRLARARFSFAMALMSRSAIGLPEAIAQAGESTGNSLFRHRLKAAIEAVKQGESLTAALGGTGLFDSQYVLVLETGETAGQLEETFQRLNRLTAEDAKFALGNIATLTTWGLYVGYMAFMGYMIFKMWSTVTRHIYGPLLEP